MIGYYVHHVGRGHLERARCIVPHLDGPVTGLSSIPRPMDWPGDWIHLDRDDEGPCDDVTANTVFHWAPRHHPGLCRRMQQIADWISTAHPQTIVCDVSVEVAAFSRLMGVPVVVIALAGDRTDPPHLLGYRLSDAIVAPWPAHLAPSTWDRSWDAKTHYVGAFSRFDDREHQRAPITHVSDSPRRVLALFGLGGTDVTDHQLREAKDSTSYSWNCPSLDGRWLEDPWADLCAADVVVTHTGNGCLSAVAAACRPAVVIPQSRPFGEQTATAEAIQDAGLARVEWSWPDPPDWEAVLDAAVELGGNRWNEWCFGDGAERAARAIQQTASALRA